MQAEWTRRRHEQEAVEDDARRGIDSLEDPEEHEDTEPIEQDASVDEDAEGVGEIDNG